MGEERYQRKKARSERLDAAQSLLGISNSTSEMLDAAHILLDLSNNSTSADSADTNTEGSCVEGSSSNRRDEQHILIIEQDGSELWVSEVQTELTSHQITLTQQELNSA